MQTPNGQRLGTPEASEMKASWYLLPKDKINRATHEKNDGKNDHPAKVLGK